MNNFNVNTPDEWKENLYAKTIHKKRVRTKPITILAVAVITTILLSCSVFAVRIAKAPEYFGSLYLGKNPVADKLYSEKNYIFDSDNEDLSLKCKGIAGDNYCVFMIFELKSKGEIVFDKNKSYRIEELDQQIPFVPDYGKGMLCNVIDEHTLEIEVSLSNTEGNNIVGNTIKMYFENILVYEQNTFNLIDVIECNFSGKFAIDYRSTVKKLTETENSVNMAGVEFKPVKGKISNFHFDYTLEVIGNKDVFERLIEEDFITGTLNLNYVDGTREEYRIKMPPEKENDVFAVAIGKRDEKLHVILNFPEPIRSDNIISVELNNMKIFVDVQYN